MDDTVTPPSQMMPDLAPQRQGLEPIHLVPFLRQLHPEAFSRILPARGWAP